MIIAISTKTIVVAVARDFYYHLRFVAAIRVKRTLQRTHIFLFHILNGLQSPYRVILSISSEMNHLYFDTKLVRVQIRECDAL